MNPLTLAFYLREDVLLIAQELLGKVIETDIKGIQCSGIISETEAYAGIDDKASHAFGGRRTLRNEAMYGRGGQAYVYVCYGIHHLFNVVTNGIDIPHAVLIRGVIPFRGAREMAVRRKMQPTHPRFSSGPGTLTQAMGIDMRHNTVSLQSDELRICDIGVELNRTQINSTPRIGVDYAGKDALLPYRFTLKDSTTDQLRNVASGFDENR